MKYFIFFSFLQPKCNAQFANDFDNCNDSDGSDDFDGSDDSDNSDDPDDYDDYTMI